MLFALDFPLQASARERSIECEPGFLRQESDGACDYFLFGRIYGGGTGDQRSLADVARQLEREGADAIDGRYLLISVDRNASRLRGWVDRYRLLSPMVYVGRDRVWLGNWLPYLRAGSGIALERDEVAAESLRLFGATARPRTLYRGLQFVQGSFTIDLSTRSLSEEDSARNWPSEVSRVADDEWLSALRSSVARLCAEWRPTVFRLSGGADTRLIASLLPQEAKGRLRGEVLRHPSLSADDDGEVHGARRTAEMAELSLEVVTIPSYAYFETQPGTRVLGGLYGGEFLGGQMDVFSPWRDQGSAAGLSEAGELASREWRARCDLLGERRHSVELFLGAFRSMIYDSVMLSWASPHILHLFCLSPFVERAVLDRVIASRAEDLADYKLYARLFRAALGEERSGWPLLSPLARLQAGFSFADRSVNPKALQSPTETAASGPTTADSLRRLNLDNFFRTFGV